jgi:predicted nucleic acid-binding protein
LILIDTSVWVEVLRKPSRLQLEEVAGWEEITTCLPVVQELLQGIRDPQAYRFAREAMLSLPLVEAPLRTEVFLEAAELFRTARRAGLTVSSGFDCLIAACALRNGLILVHRDQDFDRLARVSPLVVRNLSG